MRLSHSISHDINPVQNSPLDGPAPSSSPVEAKYCSRLDSYPWVRSLASTVAFRDHEGLARTLGIYAHRRTAAGSTSELIVSKCVAISCVDNWQIHSSFEPGSSYCPGD